MTDYVHFNPAYDDLPMLPSKRDQMTDETREFDSKIAYMRDLLKEVSELLAEIGRVAGELRR